MASLKRQRQIQQRRLRREKRQKFLVLSPEERGKIQKVKQDYHEFMQSYRGLYYTPYIWDENSLHDINGIHGKDFGQIVKGLSRKFPNQLIEVLDEGTGRSSLFEELPEAE